MKIIISTLVATLLATPAMAQAAGCGGTALPGIKGVVDGKQLADGTIVGKAKVNINIDGFGHAYHPNNAAAGALIHLCNAGEVSLPNGKVYQGSESNATCTGKFMADFARIGAANWNTGSVGAIRWYGILGTGEATIAGHRVQGVKPVLQADGSGFYVSPTAFADGTIADPADQSRYVNALRIPAAVIPGQSMLALRGVVMGSFGVAIDPLKGKAVPFVVGDFGPRVGEATPALARSLAGLAITDSVTRANRFAGQVDAARVVWVFFGKAGPTVKYRSADEQHLVRDAQNAFTAWGGEARLRACLR